VAAAWSGRLCSWTEALDPPNAAPSRSSSPPPVVVVPPSPPATSKAMSSRKSPVMMALLDTMIVTPPPDAPPLPPSPMHRVPVMISALKSRIRRKFKFRLAPQVSSDSSLPVCDWSRPSPSSSFHGVDGTKTQGWHTSKVHQGRKANAVQRQIRKGTTRIIKHSLNKAIRSHVNSHNALRRMYTKDGTPQRSAPLG